MKLQVNSYIKRYHSGEFREGKVLFESIVTNEECSQIPTSLKVNLSKSGNPNCDTPILHMQTHNGHAGTFQTHSAMRHYIARIVDDMHEVVKTHNESLIADTQSTKNKLPYVTLEDNDDLVPKHMAPDEWMQFATGMDIGLLDEALHCIFLVSDSSDSEVECEDEY